MILARTTSRRSYASILAAQLYNDFVRDQLNPLLWLQLQEITGSIASNSAYLGGIQPPINANFEFDDGGTDFSAQVTGDATIVFSSGVATLTRPTSGVCNLRQLGLTAGDTYRATIVINAITGTWRAVNNTSSVVYQTFTTPGTKIFNFVSDDDRIGFAWQSGPTPSEAILESFKVEKVGELDAGYVGPTLDDDLLLGKPAPTLDGSNDDIPLEFNRLESEFDPADFTMVIAFKLSSAQRQDANVYMAQSIGVDGDNRIAIFKSAANTITVQAEVGNVITNRNFTLTAADDDKWNLIIMTANEAGNRLTLYIKTTASETTYPAGTWTGSDLTAAYCELGSQNGSVFCPNALVQHQLV